MSETLGISYEDFKLPEATVSKLDVARLVHEFERLDDEMTAASVRAKTGDETHNVPVMSDQLEEFLDLNQLALGDARQRSELIQQLRLLKSRAPVVHMTFSVTADQESLGKIATWLRDSVHPQSLIAVGLQPALVAGVYLRTPNKVHDLSLRSRLSGRRESLVQELEQLRVSN